MENKFNLDEKLDEFVKEEKRGTTQKVEQKVNYKNANRGKKKIGLLDLQFLEQQQY